MNTRDASSEKPPSSETTVIARCTHTLTRQYVKSYKRFARWLHARRNPDRRASSLLANLLASTLIALILLCLGTALSFPSYTTEPPHYVQLRRRIHHSATPGRGNLDSQQVFIAASLFDPDGSIASGAWGDAVIALVDLLGPDNVFVSIYESDSGQAGPHALDMFKSKLQCQHSIETEATFSDDHYSATPLVRLDDGTIAMKRIAYLAHVRNRALEPLHRNHWSRNETRRHYDKVLYLNDVIFSPAEAALLLFATNAKTGADGKATSTYRAACAVDFDNPFKFYDTFATRDADGYGSGVPLYPWFTSAGSGISRRDVLQQTDAVRVKSCWGGMVALDAHFFSSSSSDSGRDRRTPLDGSPLQFRADVDLDHEYSECCLIMADLAAAEHSDGNSTASARATPPLPRNGTLPEADADVGIYMNPYVRVAYTLPVFRLLWLGRRLERLLSPIQALINFGAGMPRTNPRRTVAAQQPLRKTVWQPQHQRQHADPDPGAERLTPAPRLDAPDAPRQQQQQQQRQQQQGRLQRRTCIPRDARRQSGAQRAWLSHEWVEADTLAAPGEFCAVRSLMVRRVDGERTGGFELFREPYLPKRAPAVDWCA